MPDYATATKQILNVHAADDVRHFSVWTQHYNVGFRAGRRSPVLREADGSRGIQSCGADRVLQAPVGELGYVAHGAIHGQDAAGEFAIGSCTGHF